MSIFRKTIVYVVWPWPIWSSQSLAQQIWPNGKYAMGWEHIISDYAKCMSDFMILFYVVWPNLGHGRFNLAKGDAMADLA